MTLVFELLGAAVGGGVITYVFLAQKIKTLASAVSAGVDAAKKAGI